MRKPTMIRRRTILQGSAGLLAMPAIVSRANAASSFDWKQFKGQHIEVSLTKNPRSDVLQKHQKEFEAMTGISVGSEQIPEQQQRPKAALEMASGHPSFDVLMVSLHVSKRLFGSAHWLEDMRPYLANPQLTAPDYDFADIGAGAVKTATQADGRMDSLPLNPDLWIIFWNKAIFKAAGLAYPSSMDELLTTARHLTDKKTGTYGFVGRGLKNANLPVYTSWLLGQDQLTVTPDGKKLLTDTPEAIWAADFYAKTMRECAPPGSIGFNWNECQTSFAQGKIGMWLDGVGFSAPLIDPKASKIVHDVGFAVVPKGPKAQHSASFVDSMGIPASSKKKGAAYLYCQWATSKKIMGEILRTGSGTPARLSVYTDPNVVKDNKFGKEWLQAVMDSQKISAPGLPEIIPVTEFRDTFGVALTNMISGADPAKEMKRATAEFQPILDKSNAG
ncbi:MAG: extracellular solute-binding protein [Rhodospirillales bacterium]|nr:extracellular solute-binding protein [Rhodospirillales bacterium]MDE2197806.1 extracellular solute-binding protein [Rhodospirillales bacterium]MDE2575278.1 extracellular solute-binding protein [Rhodospirillales bacterium]